MSRRRSGLTAAGCLLLLVPAVPASGAEYRRQRACPRACPRWSCWCCRREPSRSAEANRRLLLSYYSRQAPKATPPSTWAMVPADAGNQSDIDARQARAASGARASAARLQVDACSAVPTSCQRVCRSAPEAGPGRHSRSMSRSKVRSGTPWPRGYARATASGENLTLEDTPDRYGTVTRFEVRKAESAPMLRKQAVVAPKLGSRPIRARDAASGVRSRHVHDPSPTLSSRRCTDRDSRARCIQVATGLTLITRRGRSLEASGRHHEQRFSSHEHTAAEPCPFGYAGTTC